MKVYKCDSCDITIEKPHEQKMKEFCLVCDYDEHGIFPMKRKKKVKVHLCENCYTGLYIIVKRKETENGK